MTKTQTEKPTWSEHAERQFSMLTSVEKAQLEPLLNSESKLRKLAKSALRAGPDNCFYITKGLDDLYVVYELDADRVQIVMLAGQNTIDILPGRQPVATPQVQLSKPQRSSKPGALKV